MFRPLQIIWLPDPQRFIILMEPEKGTIYRTDHTIPYNVTTHRDVVQFIWSKIDEFVKKYEAGTCPTRGEGADFKETT